MLKRQSAKAQQQKTSVRNNGARRIVTSLECERLDCLMGNVFLLC